MNETDSRPVDATADMAEQQKALTGRAGLGRSGDDQAFYQDMERKRLAQQQAEADQRLRAAALEVAQRPAGCTADDILSNAQRFYEFLRGGTVPASEVL